MIANALAVTALGIGLGLLTHDASLFGLGVFAFLIALTLVFRRDHKRNRSVIFGDWNEL